MTTDGDAPKGAGGANEPDWIDQILERASNEVEDAKTVELDAPGAVRPPATQVTPPQAGSPQAGLPQAGSPQAGLPQAGSPQAGLPQAGLPQAGLPQAGTSPVEPVPLLDDLPRWSSEETVDASPATVVLGSGTMASTAAAETQDLLSDRTTSDPNQDQLGEIRWAESTPVTPASTTVASTVAAQASPAAVKSPPTTTLTAADVGRSAYEPDLASVGEGDPEGWDKLSWQDMDSGKVRAGEIPEAGSFSQVVREWGPVLIAAVAIAMFIRLFVVQAYHIPSPSMVPTLETGDRVVVNRLSYQAGEVERGQVVVFEKPPNVFGENDLIKRIIGLPGETVTISDRQIYIDGLRLEEPYLREQNSTRSLGGENPIPGCDQAVASAVECVVPEGHVLVFGDNRLSSQDGRVFGPVPIDSIVGRAFVRVWPLTDAGGL